MPRNQNFESPPVDIILAPYGFGGTDNLAQEGTYAILNDQELLRRLSAIGLKCSQIQASSLGPFEIEEEPNRIRNLEIILTVNDWIANTVKASCQAGHLPLVLGGDGSLSLGSIVGLIEANSKSSIGIIWLSNHLNNSSPRVTKSWNANRMIFTAMTFDQEAKHPDFIRLMNFHNLGTPILDKAQIVHIGINHKSAQEKADHKFFTMEDIDDLGIHKVVELTLDHFKDTKHIHLIWDMNSLDLSAVSNYSLGQLSYREALIIARQIDLHLRRSSRLSSIDLVEHCPSREAWDKRGEGGAWITDILCNLFGENIFNAARKY